MTIHVISVGLSVLDSLCDQDRLDRLGMSPDLIKAIGRARPHEALAHLGARPGGGQASAWLAGTLAAAADPLHDPRSAEAFAALAGAVKPGQWDAGISAELETLGKVEGATMPLRAADTAVLVCTDTAPGLLAGAWNAAALAGGDLGRVSYLPDPRQRLGEVRGRVLLVRVEGLDARSERGFAEAMAGLGALARNLLDSPQVGDDDPVRFYLSGGFKAAIPYLIGLAEGVRSADPGREVNAYVRHETGRSGAIRLPLRRMIARRVREELGYFDEQTGACDQVPEPRLLEGYAYERVSGRYQLTPFGKGLLALFPRLSEHISP